MGVMAIAPRQAARARTARQQAAFLEAFVALGTVEAACRRVGVGRRTVYDWAEDDESFADRFQEARAAVADRLEQECRRRALDGTAEPVFFEGRVVGARQRYSDLCLLALLRAYRPERFGRDSHQVRTAAPSVPVRRSDAGQRHEGPSLLNGKPGVKPLRGAASAGPNCLGARRLDET